MKKPELLAPCGDLYRAKLAISYGANAVYLGGRKYSLRARASNFSEKEVVFGGVNRLRELVDNSYKILNSDLQVIFTGCTAGIIGDDGCGGLNTHK